MKKILYILALVTFSISCKKEVVEETLKDDGLITVTTEQFKSGIFSREKYWNFTIFIWFSSWIICSHFV